MPAPRSDDSLCSLPGRGVPGSVCIAEASILISFMGSREPVVQAAWFDGAGYHPIKSVAELGRRLATGVVEVVNWRICFGGFVCSPHAFCCRFAFFCRFYVLAKRGRKHRPCLRRVRLRSLKPSPSCHHRPILQNHPAITFGSGRTAYGPIFQRAEPGSGWGTTPPAIRHSDRRWLFGDKDLTHRLQPKRNS